MVLGTFTSLAALPFSRFCSWKTEIPYSLDNNPPSFLFSTPDDLYFISTNSPNLGVLCTWNHIMLVPSCLAYFTVRDVSKVHLCGMARIPFLDYSIVWCAIFSLLIHLSMNTWVVSVFWQLWTMFPWTLCTSVCLSSHFRFLWLYTWSGVSGSYFPASWGTVKLFSYSNHTISYSSQQQACSYLTHLFPYFWFSVVILMV
jgi:hypothetical protein